MSDLAALGFSDARDVWYSWKATGKDRITFLRLLRHPSLPCWVAVYACQDPKSVARTFYSRLADGSWLQTGDRTSDQAIIVDPSVVAQRGSSSDSCAHLLEMHRRKLTAIGVAPVPLGDQLAEHAMARNAWVEGLLQAHHARTNGPSVRLEPHAIFAPMPRFVVGWFI